eukprot:scaffold120888_cov39-Phaeocystis_antarctica.AAC.1
MSAAMWGLRRRRAAAVRRPATARRCGPRVRLATYQLVASLSGDTLGLWGELRDARHGQRLAEGVYRDLGVISACAATSVSELAW